ncbi:prepilin peptidase [Helicobacter sp. 11S02596-1]|uniref:A24 family peptidase n=1 Tax=Helicobacter sp. 11S02596-1 TaxID=1476194 RepID=UPI000BDA81E9|nr:prepilin peptidase [Helicobacter sp. 11S02596-1]PAF43638.1 hypothetical protein BJI48_05120 [Helicobacter sp. 11S02596-1]
MEIIFPIKIILTIAWLALGFWVIATDIFYRKITNPQVGFTLILGLASLLLLVMELQFYTGAIVLGVGYILWHLGVCGAGDVKLLAAMSCFVPTEILFDFLFVVSLIGFVVGVVVIVLHLLRKRDRSVPYGVAIVTSFWVFFIPIIFQKSII